jgi:hypothetical protein
MQTWHKAGIITLGRGSVMIRNLAEIRRLAAMPEL